MLFCYFAGVVGIVGGKAQMSLSPGAEGFLRRSLADAHSSNIGL